MDPKFRERQMKTDEENFSDEKVTAVNLEKLKLQSPVKKNPNEEQHSGSQDKNSSEVNPNAESSSTKSELKNYDSDAAKRGSNAESSLAEQDAQDRNIPREEIRERNTIEQRHFCRLYEEVCGMFRNCFPVERSVIEEALKDIKNSFKNYSSSSLDYNLKKYLIAYFEHYSTLNTAVSRHRFSHAIRNCEELKSFVMNKSELRIISLGGGAGTDMVGFCSALQECGEESTKLLNLCVVDKWGKWNDFYDNITKLLKEKNFGNASTLFQKSEVYTSFMEVDLMDINPPEQYNSALRSADIVLLARVLDSLNFQEVIPKDMLNNIAQRMKKGAMLFLLDCYPQIQNQFLTQLSIADSYLGEFFVEMEHFEHAAKSKAQIAVYYKNQ